MVLKEKGKKWENRLIALITVGVLFAAGSIAFDFYYDLNDDVLMKDILAGVYTGTPEGHNIQMLWVISGLISLLYRLAGGLPWYGIFLCVCHFGCILLILERSLSLCKSLSGKLFAAAVEGMLFLAFFTEHLVFAQYTVTCTLLGATAAFLFYTTDITLSAKQFILKNIPAVLLVTTAYLIRSEMLLLILPMICVAGAAKWGSEKKIFTKEHAIKYLSVIGLIFLGIVLGEASHRLAYSSPEWRTFTEFFDNRTELYDFQAIPPYEEHKEFYDSIGLSESEKILLDNYNFGMDEEIDEKLIGEVASYAGRVRSEEKPFMEKLREKLSFYRYRLTHGSKAAGSDYPWNCLVILEYVMVFLAAVCFRKKTAEKETADKIKGKGLLKNGLGIAWKLLFLFAVRTLLWMYILMGERDPVRITHSLYLMEACILAAMLFVEMQGMTQEKKYGLFGGICGAALLVLSAAVLKDTLPGLWAEQQLRAEVNEPYRELFAVLSDEKNKDNFYLIDVYSSVAYSEKMFKDVDNSQDNYDIMGGWACKSPLQKKKLSAFGITDMEKALKDRKDVFFVRKKSEDMQWLYDYYEGHGTPVKTALLDTVAEEFEIYEVCAVN